jgi:hypothetical protein
VTALLDFTLYSFPFPTHLGPLDLYLDSHRTIANAHGSPLIVATGYEPGGRLSIFIIFENDRYTITRSA